MAIEAFQRLTDSLLARLGEEAVLRGDTPTRVNVQHRVEVVGEFGEMVLDKQVATLPLSAAPMEGDTLTVGAKSYVLDAYIDGNGYSVRHAIREV